MSIKNYLQNRNDYYVLQDFVNVAPGKFNNKEQISAILRKTLDIKDNVSRSITFLNSESDTISETIEASLDKLEAKLQVIRDNAIFLNKVKMELRSISRKYDIAVIDLNNGKFDDLVYSPLDRGLILDTNRIYSLSKGKIHIEEEFIPPTFMT